MSESKNTVLRVFGRLLCWLGIHDFRVVNVTFGFSAGDSVEKVECKRCNLVTARHGR